MDEDDKCITYGHSKPRVVLDYTYTTSPEGVLIRSKRRKKIVVCEDCGGRVTRA